MYLRRLSLSNFRCYRRLSLTLPNGAIAIVGRNAQGKTSLLEAIYLLATTRSPSASTDREWVSWAAGEEPIPFGRVYGEVARAGETVTIEVINLRQAAAAGEDRWAKRVKVNAAPRRAIDVLGQLNVVLFTPQDLRIVDGGPGERRRYLDGLLCQIDPRYCQTLARYNRVLAQRNHLLRRLRERGKGGAEELSFWDERLAGDGASILARRLTAVERLGELAEAAHAVLAGDGPPLQLGYRASLADETGARPSPMAGIAETPGDYRSALPRPIEALRERLLAGLAERRRLELSRGMTLVGPHRDDLAFAVGGVDMRTYGSRGQQRSVTLALKLAESRLMWAETGERPVILLDDVLSELDPGRQAQLLGHLDPRQQTLITTTDLASLPADYLATALVLHLRGGEIVSAEQAGRPVTPPLAPPAAPSAAR
ncbi:MAG: DNA replication/repair protein RecF [Chloroflexi bacterium]|nr:DNA replication/repair protein RecF [Chloroflexota bacterium]